MVEIEYINANDLEEFRNEIMDKFLSLCNYNDFNKLTLLRIGETIDQIYDKYCSRPFADVVEVKHGKWVAASDKPGVYIGLKCSLCGGRITYSEKLNGNHLYCHKCGAKMDGDK